jgi:N-acetylneuraminate synthase
MNKYLKPYVIAEIGCNHKGDIAIAKELIHMQRFFCVDAVKFQKRNNRELPEEQYDAPHPNVDNSYGHTYGAHQEF